MSVVLALLLALVGLLVGAFAAHAAEAVLAERTLRLPYCPYCEASLQRLQWSVALGWLTGRGRCRSCARYLRVARLAGELFLALTWGLLVARFGLNGRSLFALLSTLPLAMVLVTDLETKLIPNRIMYPSILAMLIIGTLFGPAVPSLTTAAWWHVPAGGLVGFLVMWLLASVGVALLGEGALGAGDVKLAAYMGLVTGFPLIIVALLMTFLLGGVGALLVLIARRGSLRTAIPYGPFLVLGCTAVLLYGRALSLWFFG
ncbi:MAG: prepilin peptidase [Anaerolineales bacterium]